MLKAKEKPKRGFVSSVWWSILCWFVPPPCRSLEEEQKQKPDKPRNNRKKVEAPVQEVKPEAPRVAAGFDYQPIPLSVPKKQPVETPKPVVMQPKPVVKPKPKVENPKPAVAPVKKEVVVKKEVPVPPPVTKPKPVTINFNYEQTVPVAAPKLEPLFQPVVPPGQFSSNLKAATMIKKEVSGLIPKAKPQSIQIKRDYDIVSTVMDDKIEAAEKHIELLAKKEAQEFGTTDEIVEVAIEQDEELSVTETFIDRVLGMTGLTWPEKKFTIIACFLIPYVESGGNRNNAMNIEAALNDEATFPDMWKYAKEMFVGFDISAEIDLERVKNIKSAMIAKEPKVLVSGQRADGEVVSFLLAESIARRLSSDDSQMAGELALALEKQLQMPLATPQTKSASTEDECIAYLQKIGLTDDEIVSARNEAEAAFPGLKRQGYVLATIPEEDEDEVEPYGGEPSVDDEDPDDLDAQFKRMSGQ
jgi:hypothetical protein